MVRSDFTGVGVGLGLGVGCGFGLGWVFGGSFTMNLVPSIFFVFKKKKFHETKIYIMFLIG